MSLESETANRPPASRSCQICQDYDRFGVPATKHLEMHCKHKAEELDLCPAHAQAAENGMGVCHICNDLIVLDSVTVLDA